VEVLRLLDGIVDVYLPDLKYAGNDEGFLYSKVRSYGSVSRAAIAEMFRQMGDELLYDDQGLLQRGLVIRLLVLPNDIGSVRESLQWIRAELSQQVTISLMAQYYPTNVAGTNQRYALLSRRIRETEWLRAVAALDELGMEEGWMQEYDGAAFYYRPDFSDGDTPFRDVRDFD
jgi:putative pyruvate formate lyase activating enzyme